MGRLADLDAEMHELPDSIKEAQEQLDSTKNMRAFVIGFDIGQEAERERVVKLLNRIADEYLKDKLLLDAGIIYNAVASIKKSGE
jgi:NAD(P)H-hydrate repair Nnr-like enzyme with NAD(P)H-hydrate dehydratase domain